MPEVRLTDRRIDRHPPDGIYDGYPCTCRASCVELCKGDKCKCKACFACWIDCIEREYQDD